MALMRLFLGLALGSLALGATPVLAGCALLGGSSHLEDALDVTPASATSVTFTDRQAVAERLDVRDAGVDDYLDAVVDDPVVGSELVTYLRTMAGGRLDERDVVWAAEVDIDGAQAIDTGRVSVYKVDGVDLDALADDLAAVGAESEVRGRRHVQTDVGQADEQGLLLDHYPAVLFSSVTVDPDEDLLLLGSEEATDAVLETIDDDSDSLTDADTFDDVLDAGDGADDVEYALLGATSGCALPDGTRAPDRLLDDEQDLRTPERTAFLDLGEAGQSARLQFADDDTAEADAAARQELLDEGVSVRTARPFSEYGTADVQHDGSVVVVDLDLEPADIGREMAQTRDTFFLCGADES